MRIGHYIKTLIGAVFPGMLLIRGNTREQQVAITFDDGPHPTHTSQILDILDRAGARATFFLQGSLAAQYPRLTQTIHARGHLIGNHGFDHHAPAAIGSAAYVQDALRTQKLLQTIVGADLPKLFRPPYGSISLAVFLKLILHRFRFIFWTFDSRDSFILDSSALQTHVERSLVKPGDVLLFHEDYAHTLAALPAILDSLKKRGFRFVTVQNL